MKTSSTLILSSVNYVGSVVVFCFVFLTLGPDCCYRCKGYSLTGGVYNSYSHRINTQVVMYVYICATSLYSSFCTRVLNKNRTVVRRLLSSRYFTSSVVLGVRTSVSLENPFFFETITGDNETTSSISPSALLSSSPRGLDSYSPLAAHYQSVNSVTERFYC